MSAANAHHLVTPLEKLASGEGRERPATLRVARQPILDKSARLLGYELLLDDPQSDAGARQSDLRATSAIVVDGLLDAGLFEIVGDRLAYVNVARDFLVELQPLPLPPERVVLELASDQPVDEELEAVLVALRERGFSIALDDFGPSVDAERLLRYAEAVKIDVAEHDWPVIEELLAGLRRQGPQPRTIAEKVESGEDFERCRKLGFDAFQGYFFARPSQIGGERLPSQGLTALRAMTELNATEDFDELHRIITRDAGLSMRLLRYANSGFMALPRRVGSVQEALTWLGAGAVRRFALMVALSSSNDLPSELLVTALVRARMCELLCDESSDQAESAFTVGLFSVADALANAPMQTVIEQLPFREDVAGALLTRTGELGELLRAVIAYQYGNFTVAATLSARQQDLERVYREAVKWADLSFAGLV